MARKRSAYYNAGRLVKKVSDLGFGKYIKTAFVNRWNLLFFLGASGFALFSGKPDVFMPLVLAGEATYLGLLGTHSKFQRYVDAQEAKVAREKGSATAGQALDRILAALPPNLLQRFHNLRASCLELRRLALEIKDPTRAGTQLPLEHLQTAGLDRLLWFFLRLLFTQYSLERFLDATGEDQVRKEKEKMELRLKRLVPRGDDPQVERMRKAIEDNIQTCELRLSNLQKALANKELVELEISRLESKILSLSELAINRQEPDFISDQVDQVASGMIQTEKTMNDLQSITSLELADEAVPELLKREVVKINK